jgi:hypothetical protein
MKKLLVLVLMALPTHSSANDVQDRVNYHLKSLQTKIEHSESQGRINALKTSGPETLEPTSQLNDPHYGLGEPPSSGESQYEPEDIPRALTPKEEIQHETALKLGDRQVSNKPSLDQEQERHQFIEEFKRNAARKGIHVEVDPNTLEVRQVR